MLKSIAGAVVVFGVMFAALDYALMIPDVEVSYETRDCVNVVNYGSVLFGDTNYSCENMPTKFTHVWVK